MSTEASLLSPPPSPMKKPQVVLPSVYVTVKEEVGDDEHEDFKLMEEIASTIVDETSKFIGTDVQPPSPTANVRPTIPAEYTTLHQDDDDDDDDNDDNAKREDVPRSNNNINTSPVSIIDKNAKLTVPPLWATVAANNNLTPDPAAMSQSVESELLLESPLPPSPMKTKISVVPAMFSNIKSAVVPLDDNDDTLPSPLPTNENDKEDDDDAVPPSPVKAKKKFVPPVWSFDKNALITADDAPTELVDDDDDGDDDNDDGGGGGGRQGGDVGNDHHQDDTNAAVVTEKNIETNSMQQQQHAAAMESAGSASLITNRSATTKDDKMDSKSMDPSLSISSNNNDSFHATALIVAGVAVVAGIIVGGLFGGSGGSK
jgi:hypothetical protein